MAWLTHGGARLSAGSRWLHWGRLLPLFLAGATLAGAFLVQAPNPDRDRVLGRHQYWLRALVFSPDGTRLAAAGGLVNRKNELALWDVTSGCRQTLLLGEGASIEALAFSPDGKWLGLVQRDQTVKLLDAASGTEQASFRSSPHWQQWLLFSPDSRDLIAPNSQGYLSVWNLAGRTLRRLPAPGIIYACQPGLLLATDGSAIALWDIAGGQERTRLCPPPGTIWSAAAISPDGERVALATSDGGISFFELRSGRMSSIPPQQRSAEPINCLAFSPDGQTLVSGGQDHAVKLWDVSMAEEIGTLGEHDAAVFAVAFAPDGCQVASGGFDKLICLWNTERLRPPARPASTTWAASVPLRSGQW